MKRRRNSGDWLSFQGTLRTRAAGWLSATIGASVGAGETSSGCTARYRRTFNFLGYCSMDGRNSDRLVKFLKNAQRLRAQLLDGRF